jgi:DNA-binding CsgD family transcriptional regulator
MSVTARDMRTVRDILDALRPDSGGTDLPASAVDSLVQLVPCDDISRVVITPASRTVDDAGVFRADPLGPNADEPGLADLFWEAYDRDMVCRYPFQTQRVDQVLGAEDFMSRRELSNSLTGELFRLQGVRYNVIVPLTLNRATEDRFEMFRADGHAFTVREKLLLTLLRPHFADHVRRCRKMPVRATRLTARQRELLALVARGLSNRQIAAELVLSEGTVRRHLDNIYTRLGVSRRTAAVAAVGEHLPSF